ncbi:hypothetical protein [Chitinophaga sp. sic0106]|uniref:hypothetical protein n=1 Tax=Chitinophaga sp. sic0106 TaxID=2854785 RepID=UPI001C47FCAA|nr:hypothetical protein [Chitinophaga sp. sic0106]MBV7531308.1 hypothetical protein [Chitinophaga sp. sic0106]
MNIKYTLGPWSFGKYRPNIVSAEDEIIAYCAGRKEQMGNAQLIAAAPELLEALQALHEYYGDAENLMCNGQQALWDAAKSAIEKATSASSV